MYQKLFPILYEEIGELTVFVIRSIFYKPLQTNIFSFSIFHREDRKRTLVHTEIRRTLRRFCFDAIFSLLSDKEGCNLAVYFSVFFSYVRCFSSRHSRRPLEFNEVHKGCKSTSRLRADASPEPRQKMCPQPCYSNADLLSQRSGQ